MAGTTHYHYLFKSISGLTWEVKIIDTTYAGTTYTILFPDRDGFKLDWEGPSSDTYQPIISSALSFSVHISPDSRVLINSIIEGPECRFIVTLSKIGYIRPIFWRGFITQDAIFIPDAHTNTDVISLQATDGFGLLKDTFYTGYDINNLLNYSLNKWMTILLPYLPFQASDISDVVFTNASNWFEDSMSHADYDSPMDNIFLNESAFIEIDDYGIANSISYYDILFTILNTFNLQISQWNGTYLLIQQNSYVQSTVWAHRYGPDGTYLSSTPYPLAGPTPKRKSGGAYNYILPVKEVNTEYDYRQGIYKDNLFPYNVDRGTLYNLGIHVQGSALTLSGKIETQYSGTGGSFAIIQAVYKLVLQNGTHYLNLNATGQLEWTTNSSSYVPVYSNSIKSTGTTSGFINQEFNISVDLPEDQASLTFSWQFWRFEEYEMGTLWYDAGCTYTVVHDDLEGSFIAKINAGIAMDGTNLYASTVVNGARKILSLEKSISGDGANRYSAGALFVKENGTGTIIPADRWNIYSEIGAVGDPVNSLRCREIIALRRNTVESYSGNFSGVPDIHLAFDLYGKKYIWTQINFTANEETYTGTAISISLNRTAITINSVTTKKT